MRHVSAISRTPAKAQTGFPAGICDDLNTSNDFQVGLCFAYQIILGFLLPIIQIFLGDKSAAPVVEA